MQLMKMVCLLIA